MSVANRVSNLQSQRNFEGWSTLDTVTYLYQRSDGAWQEQSREVYDCGHGAAILLYDLTRRTVILTRQFRCSAFLDGYDELLMEAPAGMLDGASPAERILKETEEETGYRVTETEMAFEAFVSPGAVKQKITCFVGPYTPKDRVSEGGGLADEGEDIEILELDFDDALAMTTDGRIQDAKTIMLLQYAALNIFSAQTD